MRTLGLVAVVAIATGCGGRIAEVTEDAMPDAATTTRDAVTATDTITATDVVIGGDAPTGGTDSAPPPPDETCSSCLDRECRVEFDTCASIPRCKTGIDCLDACVPGTSTTTTCRNTCLSDADSEQLDALVSCILDHCKAPCAF